MTDTKDIKPKKVTLRAFFIKNPNLTTATSEVYDNLLDRLQKSETTEERCMLLNVEDPNKEKDLISYYEDLNISKSIFATMLRIAPGEDAQHITDELLKRKIFSIDDLENLEENKLEITPAICRDHYYFSLNNEYLVTNLPGNRTITNLQTYIGWFIKNELLEFTPIIIPPTDTKLSDLKGIVVKDPINTPTSTSVSNDKSNTNLSTTHEKSIRLNKYVINIIKDLLRDNKTLQETELGQLISAELLIKFKKPKKMSEDEYKKILGAYLKPVADLDNISFRPTNGKSIIKGKDLLKTKIVDIDVTKTGKISEPALLQEMSKFLIELKLDEKKTT